MSSFNVNQNHPLIPREQTFVLDRKIISFHSEDRDIAKWPSASHFAVELPGDLRNVQSMRLVEISLPSTQHVFSYANQNTKLSFSMRSWSQSSATAGVAARWPSDVWTTASHWWRGARRWMGQPRSPCFSAPRTTCSSPGTGRAIPSRDTWRSSV